MKLEEDLPRAMDEATRDLRWNVPTLVDGVVDRGRREVRRNRAMWSAGAGLAAALVGGVAFAVMPGTQNAEPQVTTTTRVVDNAVKVKTSPQAALSLLIDQLPPGTKTQNYDGFDGRDVREGGKADSYVAASLQEDRDTLTVELSLERGARAETWVQRCRRQLTCEKKPLANGSTLLLLTDHDYGQRNGATVHRRTAVVDRPDGFQVRISAQATAQGGSPTYGFDQLEALATSPVWQREVDEALANEAERLFTPRDPRNP